MLLGIGQLTKEGMVYQDSIGITTVKRCEAWMNWRITSIATIERQNTPGVTAVTESHGMCSVCRFTVTSGFPFGRPLVLTRATSCDEWKRSYVQTRQPCTEICPPFVSIKPFKVSGQGHELAIMELKTSTRGQEVP